MMGARDENYLVCFDHFVLCETLAGTVVAFANLLQGLTAKTFW
ncbi:hypothetical protein [Tabrizicola sp.]